MKNGWWITTEQGLRHLVVKYENDIPISFINLSLHIFRESDRFVKELLHESPDFIINCIPILQCLLKPRADSSHLSFIVSTITDQIKKNYVNNTLFAWTNFPATHPVFEDKEDFITSVESSHLDLD